MVTAADIWRFLLAADCLPDLQRLAEYLNEYKEDYTLTDHLLFQLAIKDILEVFI